ncbi:MAG TPA: hydroxymethylbilane synthase [Candidatus Bathyarchaeia archaeon]|nr:hydroxymethylbilane synthase [Candidatus Bathyarchaeia archaeon]
MKSLVRIGTRGSRLAIVQTTEIIEDLKRVVPNVKYEIVQIRTKGDTMHELGTVVDVKSLFTQEIEEALIEGRIDIAVHSMKDLTTDTSDGITIAAVPKRNNPHDVLVSREKRKLSQLQPGARIGTSSPRRKSQLLAARGDLQIVDMRGNVDTRLRKLTSGDADAIVLAAAGLERLNLNRYATEIIRTSLMIPAVGQGALAVQSRENDQEIKELVIKIDHPFTRREIEAERAFAKKLGANCRTPIAAYARSDSSRLTVEGMVASPSGRMLVRGRITSDNANSGNIGEKLAKSLLDKGAQAVLEAS